MPSTITYTLEQGLDPAEFTDVLVDSSLGERRPVSDQNRIKKMIDHADLLCAARDNGRLVGIARAITDFAYCTYLSDLAVRTSYQRMGIGRKLIKKIAEAVPEAKLILLSAPAAVTYYPKIGLKKHEAAFTLDSTDESA